MSERLPATEMLANGLQLALDHAVQGVGPGRLPPANVHVQLTIGLDVLREAILELREMPDMETLRERMADLLTRTANALKGQPGPLRLHDWSNLPEVAAQIKAQADKNLTP